MTDYSQYPKTPRPEKIPRKLDKDTFDSHKVYPVLIYITEKLNEMTDFRKQNKIIRLLNDVNVSCSQLSEIKNYTFYNKIKRFIIEDYYSKIESLSEYDPNLISRIRNFVQTKIVKVTYFNDLKEYYRVISIIKSGEIIDGISSSKNIEILQSLIKGQFVFYDESNVIKLYSKAHRLCKKIEQNKKNQI